MSWKDPSKSGIQRSLEEWYPFYQVYVHESESAQPVFLLTTTSGVTVATAEGAELLGITAVACGRGTHGRGRGVRKTEIREVAVVSHNFQQRGAAEAGDVKFAVEQRMGAAVITARSAQLVRRTRCVEWLRTLYKR